MPTITSTDTNAPTVIIAERCMRLGLSMRRGGNWGRREQPKGQTHWSKALVRHGPVQDRRAVVLGVGAEDIGGKDSPH